jgi:excisionase family DNA binding protein
MRDKPREAVEFEDSSTKILKALLVEVRELRNAVRLANGGMFRCEEAASYLGISQRNLYSLVREGEIRRVALSQNRFGFRRSELDRYAAEHEDVYRDDTDAVVDRLFSEANGD